LKTLESFVFELCCGQTDRQTYTDAHNVQIDERYTPATLVGVSEDIIDDNSRMIAFCVYSDLQVKIDE